MYLCYSYMYVWQCLYWLWHIFNWHWNVIPIILTTSALSLQLWTSSTAESTSAHSLVSEMKSGHKPRTFHLYNCMLLTTWLLRRQNDLWPLISNLVWFKYISILRNHAHNTYITHINIHIFKLTASTCHLFVNYILQVSKHLLTLDKVQTTMPPSNKAHLIK